jgi:hypothetical protein
MKKTSKLAPVSQSTTKARSLFGLSTDELKAVTGGTGVIIVPNPPPTKP